MRSIIVNISKGVRWITGLGILVLFIMYLSDRISYRFPDLESSSRTLDSLTTIFLSILIEALPFVLIGVFASAIIEVLVSEDTITRILPRKTVPGIFTAGLIGLIFPICECGSVLIVRRLVKKGVPLYLGTTIMLAAPIVNPVVIASTKMAFAYNPAMVYLRVIGGFGIAVFTGYLLKILLGQSHELRDNHFHVHDHCCTCQHGHANGLIAKIRHVFIHACDEFFFMGKFLIAGAFLAAFLQTVVSRNTITDIGQGAISSTLVMMTLTFGLSLCSSADAFVAST